MQAILTKVLPATNTKPTRIKASCARGSKTVAYMGGHSMGSDLAHREIVEQLVAGFCFDDAKDYGSPTETNPWSRPFVTGQLPSGDYCHVFLEGGAK